MLHLYLLFLQKNMPAPLILSIETSNTNCSVCVSSGAHILSTKELDGGYTHAENLHLFVQETLIKADVNIANIHAVAVSKGPGSYTGLRIGASTAQGFCYALQIPLIAVDTLQAMAQAAFLKLKQSGIYPPLLLCPMIDARRMEVYSAVYDEHLNTKTPIEARVLDEEYVAGFTFDTPIYFFGNGMPKAKSLLEKNRHAFFIEDIVPSATNIASLAFQKFEKKQFESTAYFEPYYLKEFFTPEKK